VFRRPRSGATSAADRSWHGPGRAQTGACRRAA
jgi:hypothetical protein